MGISLYKRNHSNCRASSGTPKSDPTLGEPKDGRIQLRQPDTEHPSIQANQQTMESSKFGQICREI